MTKLNSKIGEIILLTALICTVTATNNCSAAELGLNLYGLSYHIDRRDVNGYRFNERNPGVGVQFVFAQVRSSQYYVEAAILEDSYKRTAKYATFGYAYRIVGGLSIGALCGIYDSRSVSESAALVAAPLISYRYHELKLHLVHLPEFPGINPYPSFALYATIYLWSNRDRH